jgi:hypothetical protein
MIAIIAAAVAVAAVMIHIFRPNLDGDRIEAWIKLGGRGLKKRKVVCADDGC